MTRQEANRKILELLTKEVEAHPDLRFNQIIVNKNIAVENYQDYGNLVDYYEEPVVTLERATKE
jgi:hypothetical protein